MQPFTLLTAGVAHLPDADIDTDVIFPARFLLITEKAGLGRYAFHDRRFGDGMPRADFPLGLDAGEPPRILIAGENFGCGSSREQAVWALADLGLRSIIAPSFGEIFQSNCFKNGLLPITLPHAEVTALAGQSHLTIDLPQGRIVRDDGAVLGFQVPDWRRDALINGWDEVLTLINTEADSTQAFEVARRAVAPWLFQDQYQKGHC